MSAVTSATHMGRRPYQEDRHFVEEGPDYTLFGVFDGHGGEGCAEWCAGRFPAAFRGIWTDLRPARKQDVWSWALRQAFADVSKGSEGFVPGCTASVALIPAAAADVYVGGVGDSPVVVGGARGFHVGPDHNARTNKGERDAAVRRGARYVASGYLCCPWPSEIGLQMARALGDSDMKFLSRRAQTYRRPLRDFVLVATDGAFDPGHKNAEKELAAVVDLVRGGGDAAAVVERAVRARTGDNVTAVLWRRA